MCLVNKKCLVVAGFNPKRKHKAWRMVLYMIKANTVVVPHYLRLGKNRSIEFLQNIKLSFNLQLKGFMNVTMAQWFNSYFIGYYAIAGQ